MEKIIPLCLVSFLILYLELLFVRVVGTEIRIFAYLSNLVLLVIFISIGLGMFLKKRISLLISLILILLLNIILIFNLFGSITSLISPLSESFIWFQGSWASVLHVLLGFLLTGLLLIIISFIFIPLGQYLGKIFENCKKTVLFYSLNIIFSLIGMWFFSLQSYYNISPYIGSILGAVILASLVKKDKRNSAYLISSFIFIIIILTLLKSPNVFWSPYQKLSILKYQENQYLTSGYILKVNNVGYMSLTDFSLEHKNLIEDKLKDKLLPKNFDFKYNNQYDLPFLLKDDIQDICIVGAGGGNDAAAAIRADVRSIDAVEIDPKIIELGKKYHPEDPYSSVKVNIIVDDGRSYFKRSKKKYDLVIMGLADSHTLNSPLTNLQLDNYLYTEESFEDIKKILKEDGLLFISFDVRRPWIGSKIQNNLTKVFGHQPIIFSMQNEIPVFGWGGVIFIQDVKKNTVYSNLEKNKELLDFINSRQVKYDSDNSKLTDDWPYLYLDKQRIPKIHLIISLSFLVFLFIFIKKIATKERFYLESFFLGTGFLLIEFVNISRSALLFGNTWKTNLYTITAILFLILIANFVSLKLKVDNKFLYILLFLSLIMQLLIPFSKLNSLSHFIKILLIPFLLNLPLFFSGLIFINIFSKIKEKKSYLASNLLGSAVGGVLSFASYLCGIKFLLIVALFIYLISSTFKTKA